jgi:hypothetical protein
MSWAGVWSGFLIGLGAVLLLSTLGLAVGISAADIDPGRRTGNGAWAGSAVSGAAGGLTDLTSGDVDQILARLSDSKTAGVCRGRDRDVSGR